MKKLTCLVMAVLLCGSAAFGGLISEEPGELMPSGQLWLLGHGDQELFNTGFGLGLAYREWIRFPWGVGLNLGIAQWQVDKDSNAYKWQQLTNYRGDATLLTIGPALYFNLIDWDVWNLTLETGVQFVYIDSNAKVTLEDERLNVDIDNAVIWHVGLEYEYMIAENMYLQAAGGYQMDLVDAETKYKYGKLRDTSLQGVYFRLGAKFLF